MQFEAGRQMIVGVGSALVDILLEESDAFLAGLGSSKGGMELVDHTFIEKALSTTPKVPHVVPGGSACNTIVGIAALGGPARFIGKRGGDNLGEEFEKGLDAVGVDPGLLVSESPTGRVLSVITPDAQRSMFTFLGASAEAKPHELQPSAFKDAALVHLEGYLLFNHDLITAALKMAKQAGARISLDLASFTVVEANRGFLDSLVEEYVDILIANEDEARAFTGMDDEAQALERLSEFAEIAVLKIGKRGSLIKSDGIVTTVGIQGDGNAIDTTGAGDLWAAGFLHGLVRGLPMEVCGNVASACGYEVCQLIGAQIQAEGWERIAPLLPPLN